MNRNKLPGARLEFITKINNIKFINDSKAVSAEATKWALSQINSPIILIAGSRFRNDDYAGLADLIRERVKAIVLIGEARERLREAFKGLTALEEAGSMEEAVNKAFQRAKPGDCVLLSPMCPSFDMFKSYEDRAEVFKKAVLALTKV